MIINIDIFINYYLCFWTGGASTCRLGANRFSYTDPLPPQGGAGLPWFISGSSGCSPGWLCSGKLICNLTMYPCILMFLSLFSDTIVVSSHCVVLPSQVLSCILDPLLQLCTVSASNLGTADMACYMVNSLYVMKTTLALFEFTDKRLEMLEFQVSSDCKQ